MGRWNFNRGFLDGLQVRALSSEKLMQWLLSPHQDTFSIGQAWYTLKIFYILVSLFKTPFRPPTSMLSPADVKTCSFCFFFFHFFFPEYNYFQIFQIFFMFLFKEIMGFLFAFWPCEKVGPYFPDQRSSLYPLQ